MTSPAILDPFAKGAAATVMVRMAIERPIDQGSLDSLFERTTESPCIRESTLTHLVDVMLDVASGVRPSPRAAFAALRGGLPRQAQPDGTGGHRRRGRAHRRSDPGRHRAARRSAR